MNAGAPTSSSSSPRAVWGSTHHHYLHLYLSFIPTIPLPWSLRLEDDTEFYLVRAHGRRYVGCRFCAPQCKHQTPPMFMLREFLACQLVPYWGNWLIICLTGIVEALKESSAMVCSFPGSHVETLGRFDEFRASPIRHVWNYTKFPCYTGKLKGFDMNKLCIFEVCYSYLICLVSMHTTNPGLLLECPCHIIKLFTTPWRKAHRKTIRTSSDALPDTERFTVNIPCVVLPPSVSLETGFVALTLQWCLKVSERTLQKFPYSYIIMT